MRDFLSVKSKLTKCGVKDLKRYLFLNSFEWERKDNQFANVIPVSVVVRELTNWLDYTHYEYLVQYVSLNVYKHTKYTLNDFLLLGFDELYRVVESCKFIIQMEEKIRNDMNTELEGEQDE